MHIQTLDPRLADSLRAIIKRRKSRKPGQGCATSGSDTTKRWRSSCRRIVR